MSGLQLCLSLLVFVCIVTQIEFIWVVHWLKDCNKTEKTLGQWVLDLQKKMDNVVLNSEKETEEFNKALNEILLNDMLDLKSDNPYQE